MISVRAYKFLNRMIVHFCETGSKDTLECPECSWAGAYDGLGQTESLQPQAIDCPRCAHPLGILTQPMIENTGIPAFL